VANFHTRLKELIDESEILQKELAEILHVGPSAISNWVNTERFPDEDMIKNIADFFEVSIDYLLGNTDIREAIVVKDEIEGHQVELEVDRHEYPDGLTHDQVIKILEKMKAMGINLPDMVKKE
jgi:transcriptional regulator with XRE-family HTH domain